MPRLLIAIPITVLTVGASQACATKNFVRSSVGDVNDKVEAVGHSLEQTQERTRRNEQKIAEVDEKAQAADQSARLASSVATQAANTARASGARVDAIDKASRRLVYDLVLSEEQGNFKFGRPDLPANAKTSIDALFRQLNQDPKNVYIEIEGHTDNVGPDAVNRRLGQARAEAVQRYLYEQYHIPLHKMNVISYAGEKPVATNATKIGRAQNRRVVIRIVA
jgi:outer membrane protein OmpA-like peptidoglycan-associated protein